MVSAGPQRASTGGGGGSGGGSSSSSSSEDSMKPAELPDLAVWQPISLVPARLRSSRHSVWDANALEDTVSTLDDPWSLLSAASKLLVEKSQGKRPESEQGALYSQRDADISALAPVKGLPLEWLPQQSLRSFGLRNLGNTCYANAVIQALLHTPPLVLKALSDGCASATPHTGFFDAMAAFVRLCRQLLVVRPSGTNAVAPTEIIRNLPAICRRYRVGRQEDAHEFLRFLLESIARSCSRRGERRLPSQQVSSDELVASDCNHGTGWITRIFGGLLRSRVICRTCQHKSYRTERFLDLSLDFRQSASISKCLEHFAATELLAGRNRYDCAACHGYSDAEKQIRIRQAPVVLTLHLKRFHALRKLSGVVRFSEWLDLRPYMAEEFVAGPVMYRLFAVIVHEGHSLSSGHYYAFVRSASGAWLRCDDEHLSRVGIGSVFAQQAYLLFYLRVDAVPGESAIETSEVSTATSEPDTKSSGGVSTAPDFQARRSKKPRSEVKRFES